LRTTATDRGPSDETTAHLPEYSDTPRPGWIRTTRHSPLIVFALAVALLLISVVGTMRVASGNLRHAPALAGPGAIRVDLGPGAYALYENVEDAAFPLSPSSFAVIGPRGVLATSVARSESLGSPLDEAVFSSIVGFRVQSRGEYRILLRAKGNVVVGESPASVLHQVLGWLAPGFAGLALVFLGAVMLFVRRHRRANSIE